MLSGCGSASRERDRKYEQHHRPRNAVGCLTTSSSPPDPVLLQVDAGSLRDHDAMCTRPPTPD